VPLTRFPRRNDPKRAKSLCNRQLDCVGPNKIDATEIDVPALPLVTGESCIQKKNLPSRECKQMDSVT
jgi:hypothetical protein